MQETAYSEPLGTVKRPPEDQHAIDLCLAVFGGRIVAVDSGNGVGTGAAPAATGPAPSPCLLENKWVKEDRRKWTGKEVRSKDLACRTVVDMVSKWGRYGCVVIHLTDGGSVVSEAAASRRFANLWKDYFRRRGYRGYCRFIERGEKTGRVHIHAVLVVPDGRSTGYHDQWGRCHRSKWFRAEQAGFYRVSRAYGFGREGFEVIKKSGKAVGMYFAKYAAAAIENRYTRGVRLWACSDSVRVGAVNRAGSAGLSAWVWRQRVRVFLGQRGIKSLEEANEKLGADWQYRLSGCINDIDLPRSTVYPTVKHARRAGVDVTGVPQDATMLTGYPSRRGEERELSAWAAEQRILKQDEARAEAERRKPFQFELFGDRGGRAAARGAQEQARDTVGLLCALSSSA